MIDWLTMVIDGTTLEPETVEALRGRHNMIMELTPDGEMSWSKPKRRTVRSDTHQITVEMCGDLRIYGSPARVNAGQTDNVFGSGNPLECARRMIDFVATVENVTLPDAVFWRVTRMDVTHNYHLGNSTNVKTALSMLRHAEGGRYQLRTAAESVYWSVNSTMRSGKAYAKGEHLKYLEQRGRSEVDREQMQLADGLLRLELQLKRHFFSRSLKKPWHELQEHEIDTMHNDYFRNLVGSVEISERTDIREACIKAATNLGWTEGIGSAAYLSWTVIRNEGYSAWKDYSSRTTVYRHRKILQAAGLSWADIAARNVIPLRVQKLHLTQPVRSWADIRKVA